MSIGRLVACGDDRREMGWLPPYPLSGFPGQFWSIQVRAEITSSVSTDSQYPLNLRHLSLSFFVRFSETSALRGHSGSPNGQRIFILPKTKVRLNQSSHAGKKTTAKTTAIAKPAIG